MPTKKRCVASVTVLQSAFCLIFMYSLFDFHAYFALKRQYLCTGFQKRAEIEKKRGRIQDTG